MIFCTFGLWQRDDNFRPFCLYLYPYDFRFDLGDADNDWNDNNALVGAPQLSLFFCL